LIEHQGHEERERGDKIIIIHALRTESTKKKGREMKTISKLLTENNNFISPAVHEWWEFSKI
jgi:hypothetical protein